jgi:hypothetical protein
MNTIENCTTCGVELEEFQIGGCDDCAHANEGRHADEAINRFINSTGIDRVDAIADMLESMMHWCVDNGFDFTMELDRANRNFFA